MQSYNGAVLLFAGLACVACVTNSDDYSNSTAILVGEVWVVEDIDTQDVTDDARATILFGQNGRLSGNSSCNHYFADYQANETKIHIENAGVSNRECAPSIMDQEGRFLNVLKEVDSYLIDVTGALVLYTPAGTTITARRATGTMPKTAYSCSDGSRIEASYPTTDTAMIVYQGRSIRMTSAVSASGSRYVGDGWEWWTKGMTEGMLSPLAEGESIASASGITCIAA